MKKTTILLLSLLFAMCDGGRQEIIVEMNTVAGIQPDTKVVYKGGVMGRVKEVKLVGNRWIATLSIPGDFETYRQTGFKVISDNTFGGKAIELVNPSVGQKYKFTTADTLKCDTGYSSTLLDLLDRFADDAQTALDSLCRRIAE